MQGLLLLLSCMLRHQLTDVALTDLLLLLNTFFPATFPKTKYMFYKALKMENAEVRFSTVVCTRITVNILKVRIIVYFKQFDWLLKVEISTAGCTKAE